MLDTGGRTLGIFVEGNDVTAHVESEDRARLESDRRDAQRRVFETVLSSIEDFAYIFDRRHRFTYANKPLLDLLGLRLDEIVGKSFLELPYPPELASRLDAQIGEVLETRAQVRGELVLRNVQWVREEERVRLSGVAVRFTRRYERAKACGRRCRACVGIAHHALRDTLRV